MKDTAIDISDVRHLYGDRTALAGVTFDIRVGEAFALLGPNGSGKTTLFKLLCTLQPLQSGTITVFGHDVLQEPAAVRSTLGVTFQSPSLDKKLRVDENLHCHGRLYGLAGKKLRMRIDEVLDQFAVGDRRGDIVESLSGGLQRRVELAKCVMHQPKVLLLDEPSAGLDPSARAELWCVLDSAKMSGVTVVVTTHLLEEAHRADRIAIIDEGQLAAIDTPAALQSEIGGDIITLRTENPQRLAEVITAALSIQAIPLDGTVRVDAGGEGGSELAVRLYADFRDRIDELAIGKPTLEDVFIARTGKRFD